MGRLVGQLPEAFKLLTGEGIFHADLQCRGRSKSGLLAWRHGVHGRRTCLVVTGVVAVKRALRTADAGQHLDGAGRSQRQGHAVQR